MRANRMSPCAARAGAGQRAPLGSAADRPRRIAEITVDELGWLRRGRDPREDLDNTYSEVARESLIRTRPLVTRRRERSSTGHWRGCCLDGFLSSPLRFSFVFFSLSLPIAFECRYPTRERFSDTLLLLGARDRSRDRSDGRDGVRTSRASEVSCVSLSDHSEFPPRERRTSERDGDGAGERRRDGQSARRRPTGSRSPVENRKESLTDETSRQSVGTRTRSA